MTCIVSKEPKVAQKPRNRFINGNSYELARIYVPKDVADFIMSKVAELREGRAREVYRELKEQGRCAPNYTEQQRLQYLSDLFWVLSGDTPVMVQRMIGRKCVPTDYLGHENSAFGFDKVQPCAGISIRVKLTKGQYKVVEQLEEIVEKMRSFKTDFYFHDMRRMSRSLGKFAILWVVGTSHTFMEVHDLRCDIDSYMSEGNEQWRDALLHKDITWMGAALRCSISKDDDLYLIQKGIVAKVERKDFERIHAEYVESLRAKVREAMEECKAA